MNQPHEHSTLTPLAKPTVDKVIESTAQADTSPQQAAEQGTLQASIDALNQKLVASTLARVQKEGVIRKRLEQHQQQLAEGNLAREGLSNTVTTALKKLAQATHTQADRVDSVEARLASLAERQCECESQRANGWPAYLERHAVSLVALAVAVFTLGLHVLG
ncbi:hypothetical protein I5Q41_09340 [Pseudomonas monteilii]|jgi:DNA-binding HxlR family transcriptional regulator|uniref:Uncharacterized protein n=1 Tax=Pseudomonas putida TaxID=303 RepID=A0A0P7CU34_PSEPU|nr:MULTISPECIES: hypothetical protein [Pseudomonas]KPM61009.1 hypothetical protein HB4184_19705 [Pseudomonas putida]MBH3396441.1 hypothetical protein [Pseudomonas monteilii]MBH3454905.1 hypothetical protein [Pseudomonas monteilii]MCJ7850741.1 hypothetical protein [Pseudomonas monteilii]MDD2124815.1 hypothetical protein [Pseudomonas monteilii]